VGLWLFDGAKKMRDLCIMKKEKAKPQIKRAKSKKDISAFVRVGSLGIISPLK